MKYMGSKARIANNILSIILATRSPEQFYVEPFVGGCNVIDKAANPRIGNDSNHYLIAMWQALQNGWTPPIIDKEFYNAVRADSGAYTPELVGWVGINCSYSGKWFGGFAGEVGTKINTVRNYQDEARRHTLRQMPKLQGVEFCAGEYTELTIPPNSVVYCDPPYVNTTKYSSNFDHGQFWDWVRNLSKAHLVFVSEYEAPNDFECVWKKSVNSSLSANGKIGGNKTSVEKLFQLGASPSHSHHQS